jgi:hypothetical protein
VGGKLIKNYYNSEKLWLENEALFKSRDSPFCKQVNRVLAVDHGRWSIFESPEN